MSLWNTNLINIGDEKMNDVLEVFDGVKNVDFKCFEDTEAELPVFSLVEPTAAEWNAKARTQNIKMFIQINKRVPKDYKEVSMWIYHPENIKKAISLGKI